MKRTLLAFFIITLLVAGAAFGVARWLRCRSFPAPSVDLRELNLTAAQSAQVAELDAEFEKQLEEICAAHCAARADLSAALGQPVPDSAKAAACCEQMCAAQSDSEKAALEHILKVRALLTPDQQRRHAKLVQQQLTGTCPMRVHQP